MFDLSGIINRTSEKKNLILIGISLNYTHNMFCSFKNNLLVMLKCLNYMSRGMFYVIIVPLLGYY